MTIIKFNNQLTKSSIESFITKHIDKKKPNPETLNSARKNIMGRNEFNKLNASTAAEYFTDTVVFIADRPTYVTTRRCIKYKQQGFKTCLITRWGVENHQLEYYDNVLLYDSLFDLVNIPFAILKLVFVQTWVGWHVLPVYISMLAKRTIVCDFTDLTCLLFRQLEDYRLIGLSNEETQMDICCERYMIESRHVCFVPFRPSTLDILRKKGYSVRSVLYNPSNPEPKFFAPPNADSISQHEINLLFVGGIPPDRKPDKAFGDAKLKGVVEYLISTDLRITIFNTPMLMLCGTPQELYPYFTHLNKTHHNFEFMTGAPPWKLKNNIRDYQYGLMIYDFDQTVMNEWHYQNIVPSKFFTYIELGLPVVVSEELMAVVDIVLKYDLGMVVKHSELYNLKHLLGLAKDKTATWKNNVYNYRCQIESFNSATTAENNKNGLIHMSYTHVK